MKCKKLSDRGLSTIILIIAVVIGTVLITVINNIQEVHSNQWQQEIGIQCDRSGDVMVLKAFTKDTPVVHLTKDKKGNVLYVRLGKYKGTQGKKVLVQFEKDIIEGVDMDDLWPVYNDDDVKVEIIERIFHEL